MYKRQGVTFADGKEKKTQFASLTLTGQRIPCSDMIFLRILLFQLCEIADFHIEGRIVLKDKKTGKIWR